MLAKSHSNAILGGISHTPVLQSAVTYRIQMQFSKPHNLVIFLCANPWIYDVILSQVVFSARISGTPSLCCQVGILDESSTNGRYSGSEMRARNWMLAISTT